MKEEDLGRPVSTTSAGAEELALARHKLRDAALTLRTQAKLLYSMADLIDSDAYSAIAEAEEKVCSNAKKAGA